MSEHRYRSAAVMGDYARSAAGVALTAGPLLLAGAAPSMMIVLGGLAGLFVVYGARTGVRHATRLRMDDTGIARLAPRPVTLAWRDLNAFRLRYFSTRRDRARGWMQLDLRADRSRLRLDSTLEGFADIVARAASAAERAGIALDAATRDNLASLGITVRQDGNAA